MDLPPGQREVVGFPRYGVNRHAPPRHLPDDAGIEITGNLTRRLSLGVADLAALPRREVTADFHCVAGWSTRGLRWAGVAFATFYGEVVEPALADGAKVNHLVFVGLDGFRSIVAVEDALADNVLLADTLDGEPLTSEHGGPVRLVSPDQYGYVNVKHLCRIELYAREPVNLFHPNKAIQRAMLALRPHPRARVAKEERHRFVPGWLTRRIYRLVRLPAEPKSPDA